jgi:hypothetical protein
MKNLKILLSVGYQIYLIVDIIHFLFYRLFYKELDGLFYHFHPESFGVTIAKWIFCFTLLSLINDMIPISSNFKHFIICFICGLVISVELVYGPFRGSIVGVINLLPILSVLSLFYFYYKIDLDIKVRLTHYVFAILLYYLTLELSEYQIGQYFYL